jgi:glycine/serine hydroxymethyltransferase
MTQIAEWINRVIEAKGDEGTIATVREEVKSLCARFPLQH